MQRALQGEPTGSTVNAVTAWGYPPLYGSIGWLDAPQEISGAIRERMSQALDDAVEEAVHEIASRIKKTVAYGTAAAVLLDAARTALLLVVGSRGCGWFTGALLGSVSQHCTQHGARPTTGRRATSAGRCHSTEGGALLVDPAWCAQSV
ncbi:universal stress protein [Streptomyces sp. NBC_01003]|uniref:universal stress protein n=1 Tax=Streptomyces sp. NBC_01003 TaxID=2903714 RepID=UPI00386D457A|nr:universal stress protein [Streptomyces sp. NBC_01003]